MNLLAIRNEVLAHGFDPTNFGISRVNQYINDGQQLIASRVDWYGDESVYDFSTVQGTATYAWPSDLGRARAVHDTSRQVELQPVSIRDIDRSSTAQGAPRFYALDGANLHIYPTPDGVYSLELRYWKLPAQLVNDTDIPSIPDRWHWLLWAYATSVAYEAEDDPNMGSYWMNRFNAGLSEFAADVKFPDTDTPTQVRGMWDGESTLTPAGWSLWG